MRRKDRRYIEQRIREALNETQTAPLKPVDPDNFAEEYAQQIRERVEKDIKAVMGSVDWESIPMQKRDRLFEMKMWLKDKFYLLTDKSYRDSIKEAKKELEKNRKNSYPLGK